MTPATKYIKGLPEKTFELLAREKALQIRVRVTMFNLRIDHLSGLDIEKFFVAEK
jgi:hypothetical protein